MDVDQMEKRLNWEGLLYFADAKADADEWDKISEGNNKMLLNVNS